MRQAAETDMFDLLGQMRRLSDLKPSIVSQAPAIVARFVLLAASVLLAACATDRTFGVAPNIEVTDLSALPQPRGDFIYQIGPQEALEIQVVGAELLSGRFLTDEEVRIDYPLLGTLNFADKSPADASRLIAQGLRGKYLVNPQVRVIPEAFPEPSISVGGEVERPGSYPAAGKQTLLRIVNAAGGLTDYGKADDVLIMRTVDSQNYIGLYDLEAVQRGNTSDPILFPDDIVMVGDNPARRRLEFLLQLVPIATPVAILIDRTTN